MLFSGLATMKVPTKAYVDLETGLVIAQKELEGLEHSISPKINAILLVLGNQFMECFFRRFMVHPRPNRPGILVTNIPGPVEINKFLKYNILDMTFWVTALDIPWITISVLSYNGSLKVACAGVSNVFKTEVDLSKVCGSIESELIKMIEQAGLDKN